MRILIGLVACAVSVAVQARPGDRLVPVDPLLDEMSASKPSMTFFWNGDEAMPGAAVSASVDGGEKVTATLGSDRRVRFAFAPLKTGEHTLEVAFAGGKWSYPIMVPPPVSAFGGKRLNNFVTEALKTSATPGAHRFVNPRTGWVWIALDCKSATVTLDGKEVIVPREGEPAETTRFLTTGEHELAISGVPRGATLRVHLVKPLKITAKSFANSTTTLAAGHRQHDYGFEFYRRWIMPNFTSLGVGHGWLTDGTVPRFVFGNEAAAARGKLLIACTGKGGFDKERRADFAQMRKMLTESSPWRQGLALEYDEHRVNAPRAEMDGFAEGVWEMVAARDSRPLYADYMDLPGQSHTDAVAQVSSISAIVNSGRGHGVIVPEMYLGAHRRPEDYERMDESVVGYVEKLREMMPSAPGHVAHMMSGWLTVGEWSSYSSCEADLRGVYDRHMRMLATDPRFADIGGSGMSTLACDEEIARWTARLMHHYCLEGRTDSLAEPYGIPLFARQVRNGDFMEGLDGWTVSPAQGGGIVHERREGYGGKRGQARMMRYNTEIGEHFAVMTRSAAAPNRLSQEVGGLTPGRIYVLTYAFADYDDVIAPGKVTPDRIFGATLTDVEPIDELSFDTRCPDDEAHARNRNTPKAHCQTIVRRQVFRAKAAKTRLVFSDWAAEGLAGGEAGRRHLVNYVSVRPYYLESEAELEELKRLSGKACGALDRAFLKELLEIPSVTGDRKQLARAADCVTRWLSGRGVSCETMTNEVGKIGVYASTCSREKPDYLFLSHIDVVAAPKGMFTLQEGGDRFYARGACDTKANVVVICQTLAGLVGSGAKVAMFLASDEEGGGGKHGTPKMLIERKIFPRRLMLVADTAGEAPGQLFTAEKGHLHLDLVAKGKGGHSSRPWALDNPVPKLCEGYLRFREAWEKGADTNDTWRTVLSPTILRASEVANVVSDEASMHFSCRYTSEEECRRAVRTLKEASGLEVRRGGGRPSVVNKAGDPEIAALLKAMNAGIPGGVREGKMSAATDASYFADRGFPIVIWTAEGGEPHSDREWGSYASLQSYLEFFTEYLKGRR